MSASCWLHPHFFPTKGRAEGPLQLCLPSPCPQGGTWLGHGRQRGAQHPAAPHPCTFRVWSWSLTGTTWAKQTHIFLRHDPPTKRVWEERKHRLIQLFAALHSQKSLLIMLPCLCRWLYLPAKADCLVRILKQSLQVTSYPCGQKPSLLIMRDEMTQYCQNKKSWGIIDCHQGLIIFSWCCLWVNIQA